MCGTGKRYLKPEIYFWIYAASELLILIDQIPF